MGVLIGVGIFSVLLILSTAIALFVDATIPPFKDE